MMQGASRWYLAVGVHVHAKFVVAAVFGGDIVNAVDHYFRVRLDLIHAVFPDHIRALLVLAR
jgi:hypothetical protein